MLGLLTGCSSWAVGKEGTADIFDPSDPYLARWSQGDTSSWTDGLRGGIAWAMEPTLCDEVLARMPEETWMHVGLFGVWKTAMPTVLDCTEIQVLVRQ